jgi:hypothetical protein
MTLLVMMFDRTRGFETVYRNSDRKMPQLPKGLQHKDIQLPFTKSVMQTLSAPHRMKMPGYFRGK